MSSARNSVANTMRLLNDVASRFPQAISFAAGRPPDDFVLLPNLETTLEACFDVCPSLTRTIVSQYSSTNGIVLDTLAKYLRLQGLGHFSPENLLVTNGAQEAILIALTTLLRQDRIVVAVDPTYVGLTGVAESFGFALETFPDDDHFVDRVLERASCTPRIGLVYVVPDFANPTGRVMTLAERQQLVEMAEQYDFHILEDAAYRYYRYSGEPLPTLKALDSGGRVVYVESFAKTILPGLRAAVMVAEGNGKDGAPLVERFSAVKSYISVTNSPVTQALLAGILIKSDYRLTEMLAPRRAHIAANLRTMLQAIERWFGNSPDFFWSEPTGGFFLTIHTPRVFSSDDLIACAAQAGVIALPMNLFSATESYPNQVRLAFSNVAPQRIASGIEAFYRYLS